MNVLFIREKIDGLSRIDCESILKNAGYILPEVIEGNLLRNLLCHAVMMGAVSEEELDIKRIKTWED